MLFFFRTAIHSTPLCCPLAIRYRNVGHPTSRSRSMLSIFSLRPLEISERLATKDRTVASRPNRDLSVKDIELKSKQTRRLRQRSRSGGRSFASVRRFVRHFDSERARDGGDGGALDVARRFLHPMETSSKVRATWRRDWEDGRGAEVDETRRSTKDGLRAPPSFRRYFRVLCRRMGNLNGLVGTGRSNINARGEGNTFPAGSLDVRADSPHNCGRK